MSASHICEGDTVAVRACRAAPAATGQVVLITRYSVVVRSDGGQWGYGLDDIEAVLRDDGWHAVANARFDETMTAARERRQSEDAR